MTWMVTGAGGGLGSDLVEELERAGERVVALRREDLDITDGDAVRVAYARFVPRIVVNCAAYTNVDDAESDSERAYRLNARGPAHLAHACAGIGARLVHVSTDYVFPGTDRSTPYPEEHPTSPRSVYGKSKLEGERAVLQALPDHGLVLRTAWLYGARGHGFVGTMLRLAKGEGPVDVVDTQVGQPTWTRDLARRIVVTGPCARAKGVFHATNGGEATWFSLAREVFRLSGADVERVRPCCDEKFPRAAARPAYSVLAQERWAQIGLEPLRPWRRALSDAIGEMVPSRG